MRYFANTVDIQDPELHTLHVYIGRSEPKFTENISVDEFNSEVELRSFLLKGDWDIVNIYKSVDCPQDLVDDLSDWMMANLAMENIVKVGEEDGKV